MHWRFLVVVLENRVNNFPSQISGGEQQRVATKRVRLLKIPKIFVMNYWSLGYATGKYFKNFKKEYCKNEKKTVIVVLIIVR